jgi:hypothetical protein
MEKLTQEQQNLLTAIAKGQFLKAHRDIEGNKTYLLHPLEGEAQAVNGEDVQQLVEAGLIDSNKKFPAATFWLTEQGKAVLNELSQT